MKDILNLTLVIFVFILTNYVTSELTTVDSDLGTSIQELEQSLIDPPKDFQSKQKTATYKGVDLTGQYKFQVPLLRFSIKGDSMSFQKCNRHRFNVKYLPNNGIKFTYQFGTERACKSNYDSGFIRHFQKITSYQQGGPNEFQIDGNKASSFFPQNREGKNLDGQWDLQIPNVPIKVSHKKMVLYGCNQNNFSYKVSEKNKIQIKFLSATEKACIIDNDEILNDGLVNGKQLLKNQVSFQLFDSMDSLCGTAFNGFL